MLNAIEGAACIIYYSVNKYGCRITPLKLQKLLYYVQAWSLVFNDEALFKDEIQAWVHGPVVPQIYQSYKHIGAGSIQGNSLALPALEKRQSNVLQVVLSTYGSKDGRFLESLTHSEKPWIKARLGLTATDKSNRKISLRDMKSFYAPLILSKAPPKISPKAMELKDMSTANKNARPFFRGMGSVMDICPPKSRKIFYTQKDFSDSSSDLEEMASDWENIGGSISSVMDNAGS